MRIHCVAEIEEKCLNGKNGKLSANKKEEENPKKNPREFQVEKIFNMNFN